MTDGKKLRDIPLGADRQSPAPAGITLSGAGDGHLTRRFGDVPVQPLRFRGQFRFRRGATKAETEVTNATQHPSRRSSGTKTTSETISKTAVPVVLAALAGMLLLAMVIVAVIVTVRFRRNPRGNARHLRR